MSLHYSGLIQNLAIAHRPTEPNSLASAPAASCMQVHKRNSKILALLPYCQMEERNPHAVTKKIDCTALQTPLQ